MILHHIVAQDVRRLESLDIPWNHILDPDLRRDSAQAARRSSLQGCCNHLSGTNARWDAQGSRTVRRYCQKGPQAVITRFHLTEDKTGFPWHALASDRGLWKSLICPRSVGFLVLTEHMVVWICFSPANTPLGPPKAIAIEKYNFGWVPKIRFRSLQGGCLGPKKNRG